MFLGDPLNFQNGLCVARYLLFVRTFPAADSANNNYFETFHTPYYRLARFSIATRRYYTFFLPMTETIPALLQIHECGNF